HRDIARSLQDVLEEILIEKVTYLHERVPTDSLCMSGGVALNCVANSKILRQTPFKRLFVQPAAGDAGSALGAAALAHVSITGERPNRGPLTDVYLGPDYDPEEVASLLQMTPLDAGDFRNREPELLRATAEHLARGRVIGWFQGRMEFGPRA